MGGHRVIRAIVAACAVAGGVPASNSWGGARLRMQVTVLRFAEGPAGDPFGALAAELMGRIEGVGACGRRAHQLR